MPGTAFLFKAFKCQMKVPILKFMDSNEFGPGYETNKLLEKTWLAVSCNVQMPQWTCGCMEMGVESALSDNTFDSTLLFRLFSISVYPCLVSLNTKQ